jgi:hypothetical protein
MKTLAERFWAKVDVRGPDDCWPWKAAKTGGGYGYIRVGLRTLVASRIAYQLTKGRIPKGKSILHSCDNPPCMNPAHLSPGTQGQNLRDSYSRGRRSSAGTANGNFRHGRYVRVGR